MPGTASPPTLNTRRIERTTLRSLLAEATSWSTTCLRLTMLATILKTF
jgi:hypothetical protein